MITPEEHGIPILRRGHISQNFAVLPEQVFILQFRLVAVKIIAQKNDLCGGMPINRLEHPRKEINVLVQVRYDDYGGRVSHVFKSD